MALQLQNQRRELIDANQQLDARRRFTEAVLSGVTAGVIGLDEERRIVLPNRAASRFLDPPSPARGDAGRDPTAHDMAGPPSPMPSSSAPISPISCPRPAALRARRARGRPDGAGAVKVRRAAAEYTLLVRLAAQIEGAGGNGRIVGYVLTFDDITALLGAQRQAAWAEVARRIAHEIKNPLTPIQLSPSGSAESSRGRSTQATAPRSTARSRRSSGRCDVIGRLIREFSAFAPCRTRACGPSPWPSSCTTRWSSRRAPGPLWRSGRSRRGRRHLSRLRRREDQPGPEQHPAERDPGPGRAPARQ